MGPHSNQNAKRSADLKRAGASRRRFLVGNASALATVAFVNAPARAAQFELKCGTQLPADELSNVRLTQMWAAIEQDSGGRIRTQLFPNSALGSEAAMMSQIRLGALPFGFLSPGTLGSVVPAYNIVYIGFAFQDPNEGFRAIDGPLGNYLRQEATAKNLHVPRTIWNTGMAQISSNSRPVRSPDDLRGFKIRVSANKIYVDLFKELGASPTALGLVETYTALQTKLVDGVSTSLAIVDSAKWYENLKYTSLTNHSWGTQLLVTNAETWKSLPPDLQDIIERNNTKYSQLSAKETVNADLILRPRMTARGIVISSVDLAQFRQRLGGYYKSWTAEFGPTAWGLLETSLGRKLS